MTEREGGESKKANEASSEIPGWVELENEATPHGSQTMTGEGRMVMKLMQGLRKWLGVLTAVGLLAGGFDVAGAPVALAMGDFSSEMVEGVVLKVDPTNRELTLTDDQSGLTASHLQVPGSVDLRELKAGDHVLARVGGNSRLILDIHKVS